MSRSLGQLSRPASPIRFFRPSILQTRPPTSTAGYKMRLRRLVVQPGGIVAWHSHAERPSNIYIIEGSITEYRSTCAVPIEHKAGEAVAEVGALQHWWRNNTDKPTVLTSSDLFHDKMADEHVM